MVETRPIPGYPLLLASRNGDIYRKPYTINNGRGVFKLSRRLLTATKFKRSKYYGVKVKTAPGQYKRVTVHRLVALAWHANPDNKPQVNHRDGNPANNNADNIEWATPSENSKHAYRLGLAKPRRGEFGNGAKLTYPKAEKIRALYKTGNFTQKELGKKYGVNQTQVWKVVTNQRWVASVAGEVRDLALSLWEDS